MTFEGDYGGGCVANVKAHEAERHKVIEIGG
jgi:hypothetical protein